MVERETGVSGGSTPAPAAAGSRKTVEELLAQARARLDRLGPREAQAAFEGGALLIDIRSDSQRSRDGVVPGAHVVQRNELEWRLDPDCDYRNPHLAGLERRVILMCNKGYGSSLAAATLRDMGLKHATDLAGGFQAWRAAGLPVAKAPP